MKIDLYKNADSRGFVFEAIENNNHVFYFFLMETRFVTNHIIFITLDGILGSHSFFGQVSLRPFRWHHSRSVTKERTKY